MSINKCIRGFVFVMLVVLLQSLPHAAGTTEDVSDYQINPFCIRGPPTESPPLGLDPSVCLAAAPGSCSGPMVRLYVGSYHQDCVNTEDACTASEVVLIRVVGNGAKICEGGGAICSSNVILIVHVTGEDNQICNSIPSESDNVVVCSGNFFAQLVVVGGEGNKICGAVVQQQNVHLRTTVLGEES